MYTAGYFASALRSDNSEETFCVTICLSLSGISRIFSPWASASSLLLTPGADVNSFMIWLVALFPGLAIVSPSAADARPLGHGPAPVLFPVLAPPSGQHPPVTTALSAAELIRSVVSLSPAIAQQIDSNPPHSKAGSRDAPREYYR